MTLLTPPSIAPAATSAETRAAANFSSNLAALAQTQPDIPDTIRNLPIDLTWIFARDGSLTAIDSAGQWWAGCSLPVLASTAVLKSLETNNQTSCFLSPVHAGLLLAARQRMGDDPALFAIVPDLLTLRVILTCHDFSSDILSHHLWFVAGDSWPDHLRQLLENQPGLPIPGRFIKTKLTSDEIVEPMIAEAQRIFSAVISERSSSMESIRSMWPTMRKRAGCLLIAGSRFRLWDDGGEVLQEQLREFSNIQHFNPDDPASSSPAALAMAVKHCDSVIAANISRADAANLASPDTRWITWLTHPQIPSFTSAGPRDLLLLADPAWQSTALSSGWPTDRLALAAWPQLDLPESKTTKPGLVILADTLVLGIPKTVEDLSSHRLLWEHIEAELKQDPLSLGSVSKYLDDRSRLYEIDPQALDRRAFVENLIVPAYQQGLAILLKSANLPLKFHGRGWQQLEEFKSDSFGPLTSRSEMLTAAAGAKSLVYLWPVRHVHPIDFLNRSVLTMSSHNKESLIQLARNTLQKPPHKKAQSDQSLSKSLHRLLF